MIERSMDRSGLYPARVMGDSAYSSTEMLGWLVHEHGIEPHVTVTLRSPIGTTLSLAQARRSSCRLLSQLRRANLS
jgi:hypothetical protein